MTLIISDNFLDSEDLTRYQEYVRSQHMHQKVINDPEFAQQFWEKYGDRLTSLHPEWNGIYPQITITHNSTPIPRHVDKQYEDERYKLLIYLNHVPNGGTIFFKDTTQVVENRINRLIGFSMNIPHKSEIFKRTDRKMAIGFRVISL